MSEPLTIDRIKSMRDPLTVIAAVKQYDEQVSTKQTEAHRLRDAAILKLLNGRGPTEVARMVDMSISHVKLVRDRSKP